MEKGKTQRFPNGQERENNKLRERNQRAMRRKIFAGLRVHGNYNLPKHSNTLDLLMALCEEAGWHVEKYGTIYRKDADTSFVGLEGSSSSMNQANRL